jgi:tripartite-type tricarboxylate transporter receptor subunit TctC
MSSSAFKISRRRFLQAGIALGSSLSGAPLRAQTRYPARTVRVVVPYSAGGGADTLCRLLFARVSDQLGQQFVIDNRAGGGGTIGANVVAKSPADGYTILYDATAHSVNPSLLPNVPFDTEKDFAPVFLAGTLPLLLLVHPSVQAKSVADIVALAKTTNEGLDWASAGNGSIQHLALEFLRLKTGAPLRHIPYRSGAQALNDLVGGHVKFYFSNTAASSGHVQSGSVRALAHTATGRLAAFPDLPAIADTVPGFEAAEWNGVFVASGTPVEVVRILNASLNEALQYPAVKDRLKSLSVETGANSPEQFGAFVRAESQKWGKVVHDANIKL